MQTKGNNYEVTGFLIDFVKLGFVGSGSEMSYRNVADDVLFQKHFRDLDYLDWFSRYEQFCEPRYL